jgi:lipopolysaccharide transport system permease protein
MSISLATSDGRSPHDTVTVISPTSGWVAPRLRETWEHRDLAWFFALRDIKVKYAQTALGALWTVFQPIALMLVFSFAFRKLGHVTTGSIPYPLFVLSGLVFWTFFSRVVALGSDSLVANAPLLTKTSCPRLLMPFFPILSALFDFGVTLVLVLVLAAGYGDYPTWRIVLLPVFLLIGCALSLGITLTLSAVNVRYRDVRNALPFVLQALLFLSPIAYTLDRLGPRWEHVLSLNPLVGVINGFRWSLLAASPPSATSIVLAIGISLALLFVGLAYFSRVERVFADVA